MSSSRNAPCSCGSGLKYKRCCKALARDQVADARRCERVGRDAEAWAFSRFGDELIPAGAALVERLGDVPEAAWIAEHWTMLDLELDGGGTAAQRYAALPELSDEDRLIGERIAASHVGIHRVSACRPGAGMELDDLFGGGRIAVVSTTVSSEAAVGDVLVARVMPGAQQSLWGPARLFPAAVGAALLADATTLSRDDDQVGPLTGWPYLMALELRASPLASAGLCAVAGAAARDVPPWAPVGEVSARRVA